MDETTSAGRSGGVDISGTVGSIGNLAGRDLSVTSVNPAPGPHEAALQPVAEAVGTATSDQRAAAEAKLAELKQEVAKGKAANDGVLATLLTGLVGLVPSAVSAVASAFGTPVLSAIAGPVTKLALGNLPDAKG